MFSFVLTRRNQLSTICRTRLSDDSDGQTWSLWGFLSDWKNSEHLYIFPYLNIQHSTFHHLMNQMVPLSLQRGKRVACFSLAKLWHSCCRWASAHQSCFPLFQHIAINYPPSDKSDGPPFSPERSFVLQGFLVLALAFLIFTKEYSSSLLQSARIARSQESNMDSHRQQTTFTALRSPLSLQNGKRTAGFPLVKFLHFIFPSVNWLLKFCLILSVKFLVTCTLNSRICLFCTFIL